MAAPVAKAEPTSAPPSASGIKVARRCYCMNRSGSSAEFRLKLASDQKAERGLSIRVFPGASSEPLLVNSPVTLKPKFETVRFRIPALAGVEDFRLELKARSKTGEISQIVADRCAESCNF